MFASSWYLTLFASTFNLNLASRIMDVFISEVPGFYIILVQNLYFRVSWKFCIVKGHGDNIPDRAGHTARERGYLNTIGHGKNAQGAVTEILFDFNKLFRIDQVPSSHGTYQMLDWCVLTSLLYWGPLRPKPASFPTEFEKSWLAFPFLEALNIIERDIVVVLV